MMGERRPMSFSPIINEEKLNGLIGSAAKLRQALVDHPNPHARAGNARTLFDIAKEVLRELTGADVLAQIYGADPPVQSSSSDHLNALAERLGLLEGIFCGADRSAPSSLSGAREEIEAISHGDSARLFASKPGKSGRPNNAYRLAYCQLRALEWNEYLQAHGWTLPSSENAVANAFGSTWTTIARWRVPIIREIGEEKFSQEMEKAKRTEPFTLIFLEEDRDNGELFLNGQSIEGRIRIHGEEYKLEKKRTKLG